MEMNKIYVSNYLKTDLRDIRDYLESIGIYTNNILLIKELYEDFCGEKYYANWLDIEETRYLREFGEWLINKADDGDFRIENIE